MLTFTTSSTDFTAHERAVPRLNIRLPLLLGFAVIVTFAAAGFGTAALAPLDNGVGMPGTVIVYSKVKPVQHSRSGSVASFHVASESPTRITSTPQRSRFSAARRFHGPSRSSMTWTKGGSRIRSANSSS